MEAPTTKRLNLIDAMVLVAATAVGLALGRAVATKYLGTPMNVVVKDYAVSVALMWTLAILALNLTRYYTTRRELACRPGFSAAVAVVVERASGTIYHAMVDRIGLGLPVSLPWSSPPWSLPERLWGLVSGNIANAVASGSIAGVVAAIWLVTAMAGCWRPEKSWIDRTGRALGVFWLLAAFAYWLIVWASLVPEPTTPIIVPKLPPDPTLW